MLTTVHLSSLSPYELGLTGSRDAVPHLVEYLRNGQSNERRLAASAIRKLSEKHRNDCKTAIPALLACLDDPGAQARQYALKALEGLELPPNALVSIRAIYENDEKEYNRRVAGEILQAYGDLTRIAINSNSSPAVTGSIELLQSRIEGCLDDIDALEEDAQEHLNWLWTVEERVAELRLELQNAEHNLIAQGIEGKNQSERQARLANALTLERQALEDAERQLRLARRTRDQYNARITVLQHRLHALDLLVSLRRKER